MSAIYFHSEEREAAVRGSERAWMGSLCSNMFISALGVSEYDFESNPHSLRAIIKPGHYSLRLHGRAFEESLSTALRVCMGDVLWKDGRSVDTFTATLNTALVMGSDPIKLCARLHGQCEIHTFVEGPNRKWLADIIAKGRSAGILRENAGWGGVMELLRSSDSSPVVTSYSVCESFPNAGVAGWEPTVDEDGEPDWDKWYDLLIGEQWARALEGLRQQNGTDGLLELRPDTWDTFYFRDGINGFTLAKAAQNLAQLQRENQQTT